MTDNNDPFAGMKGDFGAMMKSAKDVLVKMESVRKELDQTEVIGEAGAGLVKVIMFANITVKKVEIDISLMKEDKAVLEEMVASAMANAIRKAEAKQKEKAAAITNGFPMPGRAGSGFNPTDSGHFKA